MSFLFMWLVIALFIVYLSSQSDRVRRLERELRELSGRVDKLGQQPGKSDAMAARVEKPATPPAPAAAQPVPPVQAAPAHVPPPQPEPEPAKPQVIPPPDEVWKPGPAVAAAKPAPAMDWERFAGMNLFAWIGGFALFLGAAFFVKYSIEHDLLSPIVRVTLSFLLGGGCIAGGLWLKDKRVTVTAQTLCAAGVAILYADVFAASASYHFIGVTAAFFLMSLVTAASFLIAVRMESKYVALLGLIGGFLTPPMLSTGVDNPAGLFGYILLLDTGIAATAFESGWTFLVPLSLLGTAAMQIGWFSDFFTQTKVWTGAAVTALFAAYATALIRFTPASIKENKTGLPCAAFLVFSVFLAAHMLDFGTLGTRPALIFALLLGINGAVAYSAYRSVYFSAWHSWTAFLVFLIIAGWSLSDMTPGLLGEAFAVYLVFGAMNAALPLLRWKLRGEKNRGMALAGVYPLLGLALLLMAMVKQPYVSFFFWPVALLLNALAVGAAVAAAALWVPVFALALTVGGGFIWLSKISETSALTGLMAVFALFTVGFLALGVYLIKAMRERAADFPPENSDYVKAMPYLTALSPFLLIVTAALKLRPDDPSMIFGFGLLMTGVMLAFARLYTLGGLALPALAGGFVLQASWHNAAFSPERAAVPLAWYVACLLVFELFPVVYRERFKDDKPAWTAAASAGPLFFLLIYDVAVRTVGKDMIGFLPAAFAGVYFRLLRVVMKAPSADKAVQDYRLALTGGMTLFFVTLIFPLQFDKEWITLAWALEGAALVWLFGRVPHSGLKKWGWGLLIISFCRLALNPAVLNYHPRQEIAVFNWYLYTYLAAAAAMFSAAALWRPAEEKYFDSGVKGVLMACGAVLLFLLMNIEIADYFSQGSALTFQFSGNVARDMAYTLGWSLFASALFGFAMEKGAAMARKASFGLFACAILKLFLHDVWSLSQLYRVAAFVVTAVILIAVSFFYQRSLAAAKAPAGDK